MLEDEGEVLSSTKCNGVHHLRETSMTLAQQSVDIVATCAFERDAKRAFLLLSRIHMVLCSGGLRDILRRVHCLLPLGMLVGTLASCGYTLVGTTPDASGKRLSLTIIPFTNHTREPDLERLTTVALRHALLHSQHFSSGAAGASAHRLQGAIRRFRSYPLSFDQNDNVLQYRIEADFHLRLTEAATQRPLFEQEISAAAEYLVARATTDRVREDVVARDAAIARLAQQFADQCLALLTIVLL